MDNEIVKMASQPHPGDRIRLENLSSEILMLIFEQLYVMDPASFPTLLCLSRRLNAFITPLRYSRIALTSKLLTPGEDSPQRTRYLQQIVEHCREVFISVPRTAEQLEAAAEILLNLSFPRKITWHSWHSAKSDAPVQITPMPLSISQMILQSSPPIILGLKHRQLPINVAGGFFESIPASRLHWASFHLSRLPIPEAMYEMLMNANRLHTLELVSTTLRRPESIPIYRGLLPPIKSLTLERVHWPYPMEPNLWDFSKLEHLVIKYARGKDLTNMMLTLNLREISALKSLQITQPQGGSRFQSMVHIYLSNLIGHSAHLEVLDIVCSVKHFGFSALLGCKNLRILKLREISEFEPRGFPIKSSLPSFDQEDDSTRSSVPQVEAQPIDSLESQYPHFSDEDIKNLKQSCHNIQELDLGFNGEEENIYAFLERLLAFPRLRRLVIRLETFQGRSQNNLKHTDIITLEEITHARNASMNIDLVFAQKVFAHLQRIKLQVNLSLVIMGLPISHFISGDRPGSFRAQQYQWLDESGTVVVFNIS